MTYDSSTTSTLHDACSKLDRDGFCLIPEVLEASQLDALRSRLYQQAEAERRAKVKLRNFAHLDPDNQWVNMLLNKGREFMELVRHPLALALSQHVVGDDFLLSCCDAQIKHPGAGAMKLHSDQWWLPKPASPASAPRRAGNVERHLGTLLEPRRGESPINPPVVVVVMWLVDDFTDDNGATRVVPESHLSGAEPDPSVPHKVATKTAIAPAGSMLVLDGRTWHGSGDNESSRARHAITCNYCAPQFRPMENYVWGLHPEVVSCADPALLDLLGFKPWDVYGHAGDPDRRIDETPPSEPR